MLLKLTSLLGLFILIGLAWLMSSNRRRFPLRMIASGLVMQLVIGFLILRTVAGHEFFRAVGDLFTAVLGFVDEGSMFVFGANPRPDEVDLPPRISLVRTFAFGVLPTIVFFSSLMGILYYLGIMQFVVKGLSNLMQKVLGTSGAESLAAAANVFVGQTEAPLVVGPYIRTMTNSELMALMVGGFATVSGGLLAAYHSFGIDVGHLITASVISAPASLLIAKVMQPEVDVPDTLGNVRVEIPKNGINVIEAASIGASDGLKLALNVGAMLIAFLALIAMADAGIDLMASRVFGQEGWSLARILGYVFAPMAWILGIEPGDCRNAGELLGMKMVANEFVAYEALGEWFKPGAEPPVTERTKTILTYALSGFANFSSIGIQMAGIGGIAPERRSDLARFGLRAMLGGTIACCMTACIAGMLIS